MTAATMPALTVSTSGGDPFDHYYCCDPNRSVCGMDITNEPDVGTAELERPCPLCQTLRDAGRICTRCGSTW